MPMTNPSFSYNAASGWNAMLEARSQKPPLIGHQRAKYLIIGGGYTGMAAARRLAESNPDAKIIVLEASVAGEGPSGRNSGFVGSGLPSLDKLEGDLQQVSAALRKQEKVNRLDSEGLNQLRELVKRYDIPCDLHRVGSYKAAASELGVSMLERYAAAASRHGIDAALIGADELKLRIGSSFYKAAIRSESTFLLQPASLIRGLADNLPSNVSYYEESRVRELTSNGSWLATSERGSVVADSVLLANNAFVQDFNLLRDRLVILFTYVGITTPRTKEGNDAFGSEQEWGLTSAQRAGGSTVRKLKSSRLMLRSMYSYQSELAADVVRKSMLRRLHDRYPEMPALAFEYLWGGITDLTRNGAPIWGMLSPGLFVSAGYNGSGIAKGTVLGTRIADCMVEKRPSAEIAEIFGSPTWMPPEPFRKWFFTSVASYKTHKAGIDAT